MSSDGWTLVEAVQKIAGARWDRWIAAKGELRALPTVGRRVISPGISPYDANVDSLRQRQSAILAQRVPVERRVQAIWNEIWLALQSEMMGGRWTSTGSRGDESIAPTPIYGPGWSQLSADKLDRSILIERGSKVRIFNVRIFPEQKQKRVSSLRAANEGHVRPTMTDRPFAGWTLDEAVERIVGTAADEASSVALTSAISSGHLVPYLPGKGGGLPERLDKDACNDIVQMYFKKGAKVAAKNSDLVLFPTVCAPHAPDFLNGLSLAQVMSTYVLEDPEFLRVGRLAIAADESMRRFVEDGYYYPNGMREWRVTIGTCDPEDELEFGDSPIGTLISEHAWPDTIVRQARLVARLRFGCLMNLLSTRRMEALGDPLRSGDDNRILPSVWSHDAYYLAAERGDLLVENPSSQNRYDMLVPRWRAILLRKPVPVASKAEELPVQSRSAAVSLLEPRKVCRAWLTGLMRESHAVRPKAKAAYQNEAREKWPELTNERFNKAWEEAVEASGATAWSKAGRPRGTFKKSK